MLWNEYYLPSTLAEALKLKADYGSSARFIAGGTDLVIDLDRGRQKTCALIDISRLGELRKIELVENGLRIGAAVTHAELLRNPLVSRQAGVLAQACVEVGAPQVRNRSTLCGNIVTASPAADTVPPLLALNAVVELASPRGKREVPVKQFITGFRTVDLAEDELVCSILIPQARGERRGAFLKLGLRNAQAISIVCVAVVLDFDTLGQVIEAGIALGSVAPTTIRAEKAEKLLYGKKPDAGLIELAAQAAMEEAKPIDDVRSGANYRKAMVKVFTERALHFVVSNITPPPSADPAVFLQLPASHLRADQRQEYLSETESSELLDWSKQPLEMFVNGQEMKLEGAGNKVLLYALREAGLNGSKEGCLEGECGACTVLLNGRAVDSCLVPAAAAQGCEVSTVEGLASNNQLTSLQQSFIREGGVQCGYCTPGLLIAGSALLGEHPEGVNERQCRSALTGNLCRCTGYTKVLKALVNAATSKL